MIYFVNAIFFFVIGFMVALFILSSQYGGPPIDDMDECRMKNDVYECHMTMVPGPQETP